MNIETPNLFELASQRLKWLSDRQKVVSENIANADTSGYRAKEVESFDAYLEVATGQAETPDANVFESEATWGQDLTGNNVVLEEQILEANATSGQYKIAANLYKKAHDMLRLVAG